MAGNCNCQNNKHLSHPYVRESCPVHGTNHCMTYDSSCVFYAGANLVNINALSNTSLESILQKIDAKIGAPNNTNFSIYNLHCLDDDIVIETEQEFVEAITSQLCELKDALEEIPTVDVDYLQSQINGIINPSLSLPSYIGSSTSDNLNTLITKIANKVNDVYGLTSLTGIEWNKYYTVSPSPTTINSGFRNIIEQIGVIKSNLSPITSLPTFNTTSSCLPTKTTTTSLVTVVNELITQACKAEEFVGANVVWGCLPNGGLTLTGAFSSLVSSVSQLYSQRNSFNPEHFDITPNGACNGNTISIKETALQEQGVVRATSTGSVKGTLSDMLEAGSNVTFDTSNPNKLKVDVETTSDGRVKVNSSDSLDYLQNKFTSFTDEEKGISINVVMTGDKMKVDLVIDDETHANYFLDVIKNNPLLMSKLCNMNCSCSDC